MHSQTRCCRTGTLKSLQSEGQTGPNGDKETSSDFSFNARSKHVMLRWYGYIALAAQPVISVSNPISCSLFLPSSALLLWCPAAAAGGSTGGVSWLSGWNAH